MAHAGVLALSARIAAHPRFAGRADPSAIDVQIEAERRAAPTRAPEPPAAPEPSAAPEPPRPPPKPLAAAPPPPRDPAEEPLADRAANLAAGAAAAIAQAAKILTRDDAPADAPAIASGNAVGPTYGLVAGAGTGTVPTFDPRARIGGRPGGNGGGGAPEEEPDRTRIARVIAGYATDCAFPPEADSDHVDHAAVVVVAKVKADGTARDVVVKSDPGHGFGRTARACALGWRYSPARDRAGTSTNGETPPFTVRFTR